MNYIEKMQEYVGNNVDSLTYMGIENKKPKSYKISPLIDINWKEILSQPPKNTSETTKFELLYLQEITRDLSVSEVSLVKTVDVEPERLLRKFYPQKFSINTGKSLTSYGILYIM